MTSTCMSVFKVFFAALIVCVFWGRPVCAMEGKVVHVSDGDSVTLKDQDGNELRIRLYGIDCPEYFQDYGQKARSFTVQRAMGSMVRFEKIDTDKDGRLVGLVLINGDNLNEELIENGLAWYYGWFCRKPFCPKWKNLEKTAREKRIGLWADKGPVPPWTYRKAHKKKDEKNKPDDHPHQTTGLSGNAVSKVYHRSSCRYFNCKNCRVQFKTSQEAQKAGYKPCGLCQ